MQKVPVQVLITETQDLIFREVWWEQDLMENITLMVQGLDSTESDRPLINEDLLLEKKVELELELPEQLQDQEHTIPIWILLIKEGEDLEMLQEMEGTQFLTHQDQGSIKVWILLVEMDQNNRWVEGIIYHKVKTLLAQELITIKEAKMGQNTLLAINLIQNLLEMHQDQGIMILIITELNLVQE